MSSRVLAGAGAAAFLAVLVAGFTPLPNWTHRRLAVPAAEGPADAIVVLGASVDRGGRLNDSSLRRALHGIVLHRRGLAPLLLLAGQPIAPGVVEAEVRGRLARDLGVPAEAILLESASRTTREEARNARARLSGRARRILLVTSPLHMERAQRMFAAEGFEVLPAPVPAGEPAGPGSRLELAAEVLTELAARAYNRAIGAL